MYRVEYSREALKQMMKMPRRIASRIQSAVNAMAENPSRGGNVKALKGVKRLYRLRVGNYRAIFQMEHDRLLILVVKVAHRKEAYE